MALLKTHAHAPNRPAPSPAPEAALATLRQGATEAERRAAALELAGAGEAVEGLASRLREERSASVREAIVTALAGIGTQAAAHALAMHLRSEDAALRNDAIAGLREMGEAAAAHMEDLARSPDPDMRIFAINVLETLHHAGTASVLRHILEHDPEVNVGLAAVEAVAQAGGADDIPALRAFAARFAGEPFVAFAVDAACRLAGAGATV